MNAIGMAACKLIWAGGVAAGVALVLFVDGSLWWSGAFFGLSVVFVLIAMGL
jgi:hypothetical protein